MWDVRWAELWTSIELRLTVLGNVVCFDFSAEIKSHSTFIASAITDLCVRRRGTLIKTYFCHWNPNHKSSFRIPLPDSKNKMTYMPLRFGFCRGNKVATYGNIFQFQAGPTLSSRHCLLMAFYNHLPSLTTDPCPISVNLSFSPSVQVRGGPSFHHLKESTFVHFSFFWKRAPFLLMTAVYMKFLCLPTLSLIAKVMTRLMTKTLCLFLKGLVKRKKKNEAY